MKNIIMRTLMIFIVAILLLMISLAGCGQNNSEQEMSMVSEGKSMNTDKCAKVEVEPLSDDRKQEIENAWYLRNGVHLQWYSDDLSTLHAVRYYGTYGDVTVLFRPGQLCAFTQETIANQKFLYNYSFALLAYRDGMFMQLKDAYEDGLIATSEIDLIAEYHRELQKHIDQEIEEDSHNEN